MNYQVDVTFSTSRGLGPKLKKELEDLKKCTIGFPHEVLDWRPHVTKIRLTLFLAADCMQDAVSGAVKTIQHFVGTVRVTHVVATETR